MAQMPTSYMRTNGSALTRAVDALTVSFLARPQAMTIYVRFIEHGTINIANGSVLSVGDAGAVGAYVTIYVPSGFYRLRHSNAIGTADSTLAVAPSIGDLVELVGQVASNGAVTLIQSINGAAATTATTSAALAFATSFNATTLYLGHTTRLGIKRIRDVVIQRGAQSLGTMRRIAGTG